MVQRSYILRLENAEGNGVYTSGIVYKSEKALGIQFQDNDHLHPNPYNDSALRYGGWDDLVNKGEYKQYKFGFANYVQFRAWFHNDELLAEFTRRGVKLAIYVAEGNVIHGNAQSAFHYEKATKLVDFDTLETYGNVKKAIDAHEKGVE